MKKYFRSVIATTVLGALLTVPAVSSAATNIRGQTSSAGGTPYIMLTAAGSIVQKYEPDIRIQVSSGKAFPQIAADLVNGRSDIVTTSPIVVYWMQNAEKMYTKWPDSKEKSELVRYIVAFPLGAYHWVVRADSGIEELADIRGKRLFAGPRASGSASTAVETLHAETGMDPDKDYEYVSLDWASGVAAFQDGQIDVYVRPANVPLSAIQEFAMTGDIRLLTIKPSTLETKEMLEGQLAAPGRIVDEIAPDAYGSAQVNDSPAIALMSMAALATRVDYDADTVYTVTKTFWEHINEIHASVPWMKEVTRDTAFKELNAPLHVGAYRYYKEAGFDIPEELVPPELAE